jgi:hypothetical protein
MIRGVPHRGQWQEGTTTIDILATLAGGRGAGEHIFYWDGSLKGLALPTALAEMFRRKLLRTVATVTVHDVMEITYGEPCQNSVL